MASRVFPKFHPGFNLSMKSAAEMDGKSPVQLAEAADAVDVAEIAGEAQEPPRSPASAAISSSCIANVHGRVLKQ